MSGAMHANDGASQAALITRLRALVAIPSVSRQEEAIAGHVFAELEGRGLRPQRRLNNVWVEIGDQARPRLLLNSHLDTVPAASGWREAPCVPRQQENRLIGLGANDAKGCVSALMRAALRCAARLASGEPLGGTIVLALTAEEEISGKGLAEILPMLAPLDAAIVGEPTNLTPMTAQRGLLILRCQAHGRASHPANTPANTPHNAIMNASAELERLRGFDWGPEHPLLGRCHAHVTRIQGGDALNVVPDSCEFHLDIRTTPLQPHAQLIDRLRAFLHCDVHVHSERLVPISTSVDEPIVQAVLSALPGSTPQGSNAMSDMVFLTGVPSVKIGPGVSARSHTPEEFITTDELAAGAAAYERIIQAYFSRCAREGQL